MQPENFPKIRYLDRYKYPKKTCFEIFHRFLRDFLPVPNAKKWYFSDLVPVLKVNSEYLKNKKFNFSYFVRLLNPKITTFSPFIPVQSLQKIEEKIIQKKFFSDICTGPNTLFLDLKNF
jgi:hypothetical protein